MIKSIHVTQRREEKPVAEELESKLTYLQAIKGYKIIQIFESKTRHRPNCNDQSFVIIYDTLTKYPTQDDLIDRDVYAGFLDESLKRDVERWCGDLKVSLFRYGPNVFAYQNRFNGDISYELYENITKEDITEDKKEDKEPVESKKNKRFKIDKETIDFLNQIKKYCKGKRYCRLCPLGHQTTDSRGEPMHKCKLSKSDPAQWDLEEE